MKIRRIIAAVIAFNIVCGAVPMNGIRVSGNNVRAAEAQDNSSAESGENTWGSNISWELDSEGTLIISGSGHMQNLYESTDDSPWSGNENIKKVIIEDGLDNIGNYVFHDCVNLESVSLPDSIRTIGAGAFKGCKKLTEITLPAGLLRTEEGAFDDCPLDTVTFMNPCTDIQTDFSSVKTICGYDNSTAQKYAEENGIEFISLGEKPEAIEVAGGKCDYETAWTLDSSGKLTIYYSPEFSTGVAVEIPPHYKDELWWDDTLVNELVIMDEVKAIPENAFSCLTKIESVTIPDSVEKIGNDAFSMCTSLREIILPETMKSIGSYAFTGCSSLMEINIPKGITEISSGMLNGCTSLLKVEVPEGVTTIGESAFAYSGLISVLIPDSVVEIKEGAFYDCKNLLDADLPESVRSLGESSFSGCISIKSIIIPDGVESIPMYAFFGCTSLNSVFLPETLKTISQNAFRGCSSIELISLPDSVETICSGAFADCSSLKSIALPESVTCVRAHAFEHCTALESIAFRNAECDILPSSDVIPESATIYGHSGSSAESYAEEYGRNFAPLSEFIDLTKVVYGDSNCDEKVNLADTILIMQVKANPNKYTLTRQGEYNADCCNIGDGVSNMDALAIQRYLIGMTETLPVYSAE